MRRTIFKVFVLACAVGFFKADLVCQEPNESEMDRLKSQVLDAPWAWLAEGYETDEIVVGETHCPTLSNLLLETDNNAPLCPSYKVEETDPLRIPSTIMQTKCRCTRCLSPGSKRLERSMCKPVFRLMPVLRRTHCKNGLNQYAVVLERVSVGCQCRATRLFSGAPKSNN